MIYLAPFIAVFLSFIIVYLTKPSQSSLLNLGLSFSGAFLLSIIIFELLPTVYAQGDAKTVGLCIALGILLQILLEFFSKGAEHGHFHHHGSQGTIPWLLWGSLSLHALVEGIPLETGTGLFYGILIHKIVIATILSIFLIKLKVPFIKSLFLMVLFGLMTPLGTFLIDFFNSSPKTVLALNGLVVGVLLHISTVILFESSDGHKFNIQKIVVVVLGIGVAYFIF